MSFQPPLSKIERWASKCRDKVRTSRILQIRKRSQLQNK